MILFKKRNDIVKITPFELYKDCSELPLFNWIKLAVTSDYQWLIKSGNTDNDLSDHYNTIYNEYTSLIKDVRSTQELKLKIIVTTLANRIDHITLCINQLRIKRDERLIEILKNDLGFYKLSYDDLEKDLNLTETLMRSDILKFEQKKLQYEKMFEDMGEVSNGELEFYEQVRIIGKWLGFAINPYKTSLMQYVSYINGLKLEIKNNQNK